MLRLLFLLLSMFLLTCKPEPVQVLEASAESWQGGVKGSGRGVNYRVKVLVYRSSRVLRFDTLWVGERAFEVQTSQPHPFNPSDGFKCRDTVIIYASLIQVADKEGELLPLPETPKPPVEYSGEALLSYWIRSKRYFQEVEMFSQLPDIEYP